MINCVKTRAMDRYDHCGPYDHFVFVKRSSQTFTYVIFKLVSLFCGLNVVNTFDRALKRNQCNVLYFILVMSTGDSKRVKW